MSKSSISLKKIVGNEIYQVWIDMLKTLVPHGRTHRLSVVVASMLEYASSLIAEDENLDPAAAEIFIAVRDGAYDPQDSVEKIMPIVETLFRDAGVKSDRFNSRGQSYSISDSAAYEFLTWYNMPWED